MPVKSGRQKNVVTETEFRLADFSFSELAATRRVIRRLLRFPGLRSIDIDETRNRIVLGVAPGTRTSSLLSEIESLGGNPSQVVVEEKALDQVLAGLREDHTYLEGGLQIEHVDESECTLGFIAIPDGETNRRVVTAAHCGPNFGSVDTGRWGQNSGSAADSFGVEVADPSLESGASCPNGETCRYSDASMISVSSYSSLHGRIARTLSADQWDGSRTINDSVPHFVIDGVGDFSYVGLELDKVGRTTGWTYGDVTTTCDDRKGSDGVWRLCSDVVNAGADGGDSGSPVFYYVGDGTVYLHGILWGGGGSGDDRYFVFSPLEGIEYELGLLDVEY
jgi:hypothetical protein